MARFKRILLKLSGESLMGKQSFGIDPERLGQYAEQIKEVSQMGVQIGIVIGGGNIFRGLSGASKGFDRVKGDQMGMCATVINSLALSSALEAVGVKTKVLTAIRMEPIGEFYSKWKAIEAMEAGYVCIFSAGTGSPYFTTDTGSSLRGIEIEADVMLKGTRVDGVISQPLIENIFEPNTPLHDGAVVVRGDRVIAAACLLRLSDTTGVGRDLGTRHRAGLGVSEISDAKVFIVSEETGIISMAEGGRLVRHLDEASLRQILHGIYDAQDKDARVPLLHFKQRRKGAHDEQQADKKA